MGISYTYKCTKCGYTKESSGKLDSGFFATVEPHICNDCKELTDVQVGEYGDKIPVELLTEVQKKEYYKCWEYNSHNITLWNLPKKPYPKCGSRMNEDPVGSIMM